MAEYVVHGVIRSLTQLLRYDGKNVPVLRGRIEEIQNNLRNLQSILEIADARQQVDEGIRSWLAETREVAYDVEDLLLELVSSQSDASVLRKYTPMFKEGTTKLNKMEAKISALGSDLRIRNIRPRQIASSVSERCQHKGTIMHPHHFEEDFVGLDEDVDKLVAILVKEENNESYQVASITGMSGIGKTAMAKKIYNHADVRRQFHSFAWACVSRQWEPEDILKMILKELEPQKKQGINNMNVEELVQELYQVQERERCLIVLDDVSEMAVWDILRRVLLTRPENIKVLLTTRNKEFAGYINIDAPCYLYEQRHLDENEGWELLKKKVYGGLNTTDLEPEYSSDDDAASSPRSFSSCKTNAEEDEADASSPEDIIQDPRNQMEIERLGKKMIRQCGGLPLAIIVLRGLLMSKTTVSEWRTVHQNFNYLRRGRSSQVNEVLALSYRDLCSHLKPCFLYLGNFTEYFEIPTRKLYQLWAAEGFISQECDQTEEEESIMDVAERYLGELVQRCMVQVRVNEATGRFKSCRLHDFAREFCLLKGKDENFFEIVSPSSPMATSTSVSRRASIAVDYDFDSYFRPKTEKLQYIRSALFFSRDGNRGKLQPTLEFHCKALKLLRVLDLERFDFGEKLSKAMGNLVHLRYLSLRGSLLCKLSSSIGNLKYIQTLDLRVPPPDCLPIPNVLYKLTHLKHLYLPISHNCTSKLQLNSLRMLETLKNFDTRVSDYRDIQQLTKLQKLATTLEIQNLEAMIYCLKMEYNHVKDSSFRIICDLQSERELLVLGQLKGFDHLHKIDLIGVINRLPEHHHFAPSLTKLILRGSRLKEDPMAILEKLPNLYSLMLRKNAIEGNEMCCSRQGFPRLRFLELQGLTTLEYWKIGEGAMPDLYCLKIDECINLRMVPEGIEFIAALEYLVIINMPDAFKHRVKMQEGGGGEDTNRVEHISSIMIPENGIPRQKKLESQSSGNSVSGLLHNFSPVLVPKEW